jgi:hypothetical protein
MRSLALAALCLSLSGCAVVDRVREVWPRAHDPVMVEQWVTANVALGRVNCDSRDTGWTAVADASLRLAQYTEFRRDPQAKNMRGLYDHAQKMAEPTTKPAFCKLGIKTAEARLAAARSAWEGR